MSDELSWVDQVQAMEQSLIDVISQDGDLVVEALSNIPPAARGRLQTMIILAEEVVVQAAHGRQLVIDTGLGTASWYVDPDVDSDPQPVQPDTAASSTAVQSWADVTDAVGVQPLRLQGQSSTVADAQDQTPQPTTTEVPVQPDTTQAAATQVADTPQAPQTATDVSLGSHSGHSARPRPKVVRQPRRRRSRRCPPRSRNRRYILVSRLPRPLQC